jgi:hypothetical protein
MALCDSTQPRCIPSADQGTEPEVEPGYLEAAGQEISLVDNEHIVLPGQEAASPAGSTIPGIGGRGE